MKALWAGMVGLALVAPTGGAFAQDGTPPSEAPAMSQEVATPDTPPSQDATPTAEAMPSDAPAAEVAGWEGPIPETPTNFRNRLTDSAVQAWMAQPGTVLDENPTGGRTMSQFVRSLAGTDNRTVPLLVGLVKLPNVTNAQINATAEGLAGAMRDAQVTAPQYAAYIQWAVAQSGSEPLIIAFERSSGAVEDQTASIGAAGGAGGGGAGSGSLSGTGAPGTSGPVGGDTTVSQSGPGSVGRSGGGSVAFSEGDRLLQGASGRLIVCTLDTSQIGCQAAF